MHKGWFWNASFDTQLDNHLEYDQPMVSKINYQENPSSPLHFS